MKKDPQENTRALHIIVSQQGGYFTALQALKAGYTYRQQHFHAHRGNWIKLDWGLYRLRDFPATEHEDLIRWSLWSRDKKGNPQAIVSHDTALALHELGGLMPGKVHLTMPSTFRKKISGGCVIHKSEVDESDVEKQEGFLVTSPLRTLLDEAASDLSPEHLNAAVRDALSRGLVRKDQLLNADLPIDAKRRIKDAVESTEETAHA